MNARRFLPGRYAAPAHLLLSSRRFTCDHLLIAADAYAELAAQCVAYGHLHAARDACQLADQLRAAAPGRVPGRNRVFPNPSSL